MNQQVAAEADGLPTSLHAELRTLIASSRQRLAGAVNAELTRLYWTVGQRLAIEVLGGEHAQYGSKLLEQQGQQLSQEFGRGFEDHLVAIVALKAPEAHQFYAHYAAQGRAGTTPAPSPARSARAAGVAWGVVGRGFE